MIAHIIETRQHWGWGPRKLLVKMAEAWPEEKIPSASTVAEVLRGKGLSHARKRRLRTPPYAEPFADVAQCNRTWCADFKGWFRTRDGTRCDPLTITDAYSRFLLCCQIAVKADTVHVEALLMLRFASMDCRKSFTRITGALCQQGSGRPEPLIDAMGSARHCGGTEPACFPAG